MTGIILWLIIGTALNGMFYVIASASIRGEKVGLNESLGKAFKKVIPLIIIGVLTFLAIGIGLVLLIIPGLYLLGRFALSAIILFEEDLGPIAAIKRSFELSKGHSLEILSALLAGSLLTGGGGLLSPATIVAPLVGRYKELKSLKQNNTPKPAIHWLNWITSTNTSSNWTLHRLGYSPRSLWYWQRQSE